MNISAPDDNGFLVNLWTDVDRSRYFLIPPSLVMPPGTFELSSRSGEVRFVDFESIVPFQISEDQARRWATHELGETLDELKLGIDESLAGWRRKVDDLRRTPVAEDTTLTPDVVPALFDLLARLPGVIGNSLSGDEARVESAKTAMADLQEKLKNAGVDLDDRFTRFPGRLADLRKDPSQEHD